MTGDPAEPRAGQPGGTRPGGTRPGNTRPSGTRLHPALADVALVVFDKDGTLIDFDAMWSGWTEELAANLSGAVSRRLDAALFAAFGYDPATRKTLPGAPLATTPMGGLRELARVTLVGAGVTPPLAEHAVATAWSAPDPVRLARPLCDLPSLFAALRTAGLRIAVVTTDDREPTRLTLEALGLTPFVDALIAADDGLRVKPAPDAVEVVAARLRIPLWRTAVVGDSPADLEMARAAGALAVAVTSGVGSAVMLEPAADVVLPSIASIIA